MSALQPGQAAPNFSLPYLINEQERVSLQTLLRTGPVLLAFFKVSCPVCQFSFPYLERLAQEYASRGSVRVVGISQDGERETREFVRRYGITFPILLDSAGTYPVSNAYGLTHVPTLFWIDSTGNIERTVSGFHKAEFNAMALAAAQGAQDIPADLFAGESGVPAMRPG